MFTFQFLNDKIYSYTKKSHLALGNLAKLALIKLCDSIKEIQKTGNLKFQEQDRKFKKHTYRKNPDLNFRAEFGNFQIGYIRAWQSFELIRALPMFVKDWRTVCFKENIHWKIEHIVNIPKVQKHLKSYNLRKQKSFVKCSINEVGTFWPKIFLFLDLDHMYNCHY